MVLLSATVRFCALVAALASASLQAVAQPTLENDVKATFLYNFTKFVEWPPSAGDETFRVCAVADAAFVASLDRTLANESIEGRQLVRLDPRSAEEARHCAILYVGSGYAERGAPLLAAVRDLPVLTVGEGPQFLKQGGTIRFFLDNNRVRFDISLRAAQRSGLKVSSKLLRVARTVEGETQ
jgi:YfiR/HmsC-like